MNSIRKDLFILIIGHGRGGTSAVTGFLNSFPGINIGFEQNLSKLKKMKELGLFFGIPYIFNGNKIIFSGGIIEFEDIMYYLNKKTGLIHDRFRELKVVFVNRNVVDNICSQYIRAKAGGQIKNKNLTIRKTFRRWIYAHNIINRLKEHFGKDFLSFDFYEFITKRHIQEELLDWIGVSFSRKDFGQKLYCGIYGERFLDLDLSVFGPNHRKNLEEKLEIEKLLWGKFGKDWKNEIGKIFE